MAVDANVNITKIMDEIGEGSTKNLIKNTVSEAEMRKLERQAEVQLREKRLRQLLTPVEGFIVSIQSLLVWEKPGRSALMLLCINGLFWLAVTTNHRIVFLVAVSGIVFVSMETIRTKVWPEIRVRQPDEDEEGWTPVHPHLLSLPELCEHMAKLWVTMERLNTSIWELRREQQSKFCLYTCGLCLMLATIGHHFSGVFISYIIMISLLLWPPLEYHNITGYLHRCMEPILQQLHHSIDSPHREKKLKARLRSSSKSNPTSVTSDSSDSDLDEFCPTPGPSLDAALAHAANPVRSTSNTSAGLFGGFSQGLSLDLNTDDEFTDTEVPSYMGGLSQVPSFDNSAWDQSADELELDLPYDDHPPVPGKPDNSKSRTGADQDKTSEDMNFIASHFRDSVDDDEEAVDHDLEFPDVNVDGKSRSWNAAGEQTMLAQPLSSILPPGAAALLTTTVTTVMSNALTKLQDVAAQDDSASSQPQLSDKPSEQPKLVSMDSDSTDFEMLDREELEQVGGGKSEVKPRSGYGIGFLTSWFSGKK